MLVICNFEDDRCLLVSRCRFLCVAEMSKASCRLAHLCGTGLGVLGNYPLSPRYQNLYILAHLVRDLIVA